MQANINGLAKIVQTNSDEYEDKEVELYYIAEYIEGQTLTHFISKKKPEELIIISLLKDLLVILKNCHLAGIVHRDIKPDNIIVTPCNKIFLVDFGIGYISFECESFKDATNSGDELGNRFLRLPELFVDSPIKRDARSDLTFACGIAFFMLFNKSPRTLTGYGCYEPPHHVPEVVNQLKNLKFRSFWKRIFDTGFCPILADRWQSADLLGILNNMSDEKLSEVKDDEIFYKNIQNKWTLRNLQISIILYGACAICYKN